MLDFYSILISRLSVKSILLLIFLCVTISAKSQFFKIENFGIHQTVGMNFFRSENEILPVFTTSVNYYKNNWTFMAGPAVAQRIKITDEHGWNNPSFEHFRISGFTLGAKYNIMYFSKARIYCFVDNMLLTYSIFAHFDKFSDSGICLVYDERQPLSRTLVLQPVVGTGIEIPFLKYLLFSAEFGAGITYRHMKYDTWNHYPTQRTAKIGQLKIGLGCKFK